MWWEWTPPPAKLTHCWRCGSWWYGPCPLEPSFPPQTPSLEWTIRGDPMSLIQEFNDLPFRRRALKNICWLGYTHVSSVPAWKKTPRTRRFQNFSCSTFGIEDFCLSMGRGKGWFGAGVWKFTIFVSLQHSRRKVYCCIVVARIYSCNQRWTCFGSSGIILRGSRATEELDEGLGEAS